MKYFFAIIAVLLLNFGVYSQDEIVLITHNNYLVGGTQNGKWLTETEVLPNIKKPTMFIGFDSFKNEKPSDIYGTISDQMGCGAYFFHFGETAEVPEDVSFDQSLKPILAIGANAKWNPLPRTPKKISLTDKTYQKIALDFLKTKGMKINSVKLENAFSIDLEGDGTGWTDKKYAEMVEKSNLETDEAKRYKLLNEAETYLLQQQPVIPLAIKAGGFLCQPYVKNLSPNPSGFINWREVYIDPK